MSDDPDYDPYADWIPPAKVYMDDIPVLDPELGKVPFWKSLLWATARARTEMLRNDSAAGNASALTEEDKPPRLAADEEPIPSGLLDAIEQKVEELSIRLDNYERVKRAEQALLDLEDRIEAELSPDTGDDDMIMH
jgi:hypothetical protein